jgi:peptidoglycan/LPS O-acetylase OafA/YrhL
VRASVPAASEPKLRLPHLPALDGLRGLALLGVLLFHADGALAGGYLGVDLFFVLSGYLITSLLLAEVRDTGRVDLYAFWVRRCRRLFPALLSLMPAVAVYGKFFARPEDLQSLRNEALASLSYVANWRAIWGDKSYWQLFSAPSPLEHTWSLSIEEQFYIAWPLLAAWLLPRRGARGLLLVALGLSVVSAIAMWLLFVPGDNSRVYLGTDTRMGAILVGAALAVVWRPGRDVSSAAVKSLDAAGVVAAVVLGVAWCTLRGTSPLLYRGGFWLTELCVLVLIACAVVGPRSLVARAFSIRPLTWLGSISYGVYLWHWPVNVFLSAERTQLHGVTLQAVRLAVTFAIALISYRFLEQPIRRHGVPFSRPQFVLPAVVAASVLLVVQSTEARATVAAPPPPELSPHEIKERILVVGDSTANALGWGLRGLHRRGLKVELFGKDGCSVIFDRCLGEQWASRATELRADATVVVVGGAFLHGFHVEGEWHTACHADWGAKLQHVLTQRLAELAGTTTRVFLATLPYAVGRYDNEEHRAQIDCANASVRRAASAVPAVQVLDMQAQLCPAGRCQLTLPNGEPLRPDGVHFSMPGATGTARWAIAQLSR